MLRLILIKSIIFFLIIIGVLLIVGGFFVFRTNVILDQISVSDEAVSEDFYLPKIETQDLYLPQLTEYTEPRKNPDRINVLLLGIRGVDDPYGGSLTDTILLASYQISTSKIALISIPRDLYIKLPFQNNWVKINEAYAEGLKFGGERGGLELARHAVQRITGIAINHVVRVDFEAFKMAVELVGGIEVDLEKPFEEKEQFKGAGTFYLPAGKNTLNSEQALYYVRSRYSTSDFDRAKRTQQVLLALKDKILNNKTLYNINKINDILNILGKHVRTDMSISQMKEYFSLYNHIDFSKVKNKVFTDDPSGQLISKVINGVYVLLPKDGTFDKIQEEVKSIFD